MTRNLQKERQQRGDDFQNEIRRSWRLVPNSWRRRIVDGEGGTQPADELVLTQKGNVLGEHKRTAGDKAGLSALKVRPNQIKGLLDFDAVLPNNYGLLFISFLDEERGIDETYAVRLLTLMRYMQASGRKHATRTDLQVAALYLENEKIVGILRAVRLPLLPEEADRTYDLKGLVKCLPLL